MQNIPPSLPTNPKEPTKGISVDGVKPLAILLVHKTVVIPLVQTIQVLLPSPNAVWFAIPRILKGVLNLFAPTNVVYVIGVITILLELTLSLVNLTAWPLLTVIPVCTIQLEVSPHP